MTSDSLVHTGTLVTWRLELWGEADSVSGPYNIPSLESEVGDIIEPTIPVVVPSTSSYSSITWLLVASVIVAIFVIGIIVFWYMQWHRVRKYEEISNGHNYELAALPDDGETERNREDRRFRAGTLYNAISDDTETTLPEVL